MKFNHSQFLCLLIVLCSALIPCYSVAENTEQLIPNQVYGSYIYQTRCTLCHGNFGMGEGIMPLVLKDYPDTNLIANKKNIDINGLKEIIIHGGMRGAASEFSPPWGDELSYTALESIVLFMKLFYQDNTKAHELLAQTRINTPTPPKMNTGRIIYRSRCIFCHGETGVGDGSMAHRLTIPASNLAKSRAPDAYLTEIITEGGLSLSRSFQMPPWKDTLAKGEIKSVIMYIKTLRN